MVLLFIKRTNAISEIRNICTSPTDTLPAPARPASPHHACAHEIMPFAFIAFIDFGHNTTIIEFCVMTLIVYPASQAADH